MKIFHDGQHEVTIPAVMGTRTDNRQFLDVVGDGQIVNPNYLQREEYEIEPARKEMLTLPEGHGFGAHAQRVFLVRTAYEIGTAITQEEADELVNNNGFKFVDDDAAKLGEPLLLQGPDSGPPLTAAAVNIEGSDTPMVGTEALPDGSTTTLTDEGVSDRRTKNRT